MKSVKIADNVYWTGAVDWTIENFHGHTFKTRMGTSYNAYLVLDKKTALIDTVGEDFSGEMLEKIEEHIPAGKIDYLVMNHVEDDHSGALPVFLSKNPDVEVIGTSKCREGLLKHYFKDMNFREVKTGDALPLGGKNLKFIEAPMLHWPDSMFTYLNEGSVLFPNDAFGQHYASSKRFNDEVDSCVLRREAKKYYANILWPFSRLVDKKIQELLSSGLEINMIAPSHGAIWRKNPLDIVNMYSDWSRNKTNNKVVIAYETMWGQTARMARAAAEGIREAGAEVCIFDVNKSDLTEIFGEMLDAKGFLFGSSTHDNAMLPGICGLLHLLKGMKPAGRMAAAFGSYGWGGGAVKEIEKALEASGVPSVVPAYSVKYRLNPGEERECLEFGRSFAEKITA
jgi:anaerobic nitric oxide reductase flavorubredoxin